MGHFQWWVFGLFLSLLATQYDPVNRVSAEAKCASMAPSSLLCQPARPVALWPTPKRASRLWACASYCIRIVSDRQILSDGQAFLLPIQTVFKQLVERQVGRRYLVSQTSDFRCDLRLDGAGNPTTDATKTERFRRVTFGPLETG